MAYIGKTPIVGNFQKCDALTASATADYTLQVGSSNVSPESVNHMIVSLNGVIQQPGATGGFTVSGSTLSFTSALTSNDTIDFVILLGNVLDIGTPSDGTISNAKLGTDVISGETDIGGAIADADLFLLDDGAGGTLRKTAASRIKTYAAGAFESALLHVRDEKATGTHGGTNTAATDNVRVLNTVVTNEITSASLGSNQITLPTGTYYIDAVAPAYDIGDHRVFLYNTSDSSVDLLGLSVYADVNNQVFNYSFLLGRFTIAAEKVFELRHYTGGGLETYGFGVSAGSRTNVYSDVKIWKVA